MSLCECMNPTKTYLPIDKPNTSGVYYVGDRKERVVVLMDERDNLEAHGQTFDGVRLYDIYTQWFVPVLPPVADCIEDVELAGWKFTGQLRMCYFFRSVKPRVGLNELTFTLTEIRDAYRNGF